MIALIQQYYIDERNGAIPAFIAAFIFLILGCICLFKFSANPLSKGMGTGFLIMVALLITLGISSTIFNNNKLAHLKTIQTQSEQSLQQSEIQRMDKVMNITFKYAFITFAVLMAAGLCIILFVKNEYWKGMGIALMALVLLAIISDSFSMQRNGRYQQEINALKI
jgi:phosphatidylserine synthase